MAVFSVNQATQMYVGSTEKKTNGTDVYLYIKDAKGKVVETTDRIKEGCLLSYDVKEISELDVVAPAPQITVSNPVSGAEYLVRLVISTDAGPQYAYIKSVGVKAASDNAASVASQIVEALTKAAKRDVAGQYYTASNLGGEDGKTETETVTITPVEDHQVGKRFVVPTIEVYVTEITGKDENKAEGWTAQPGEVHTTTITGTGLKKIKDLEYFCAGEKGDIYRGAMWPNEIPFESKLTGTETHVHTIHYYEDLSNEAAQKSEKTIVIVNSSSSDPLA